MGDSCITHISFTNESVDNDWFVDMMEKMPSLHTVGLAHGRIDTASMNALVVNFRKIKNIVGGTVGVNQLHNMRDMKIEAIGMVLNEKAFKLYVNALHNGLVMDTIHLSSAVSLDGWLLEAMNKEPEAVSMLSKSIRSVSLSLDGETWPRLPFEPFVNCTRLTLQILETGVPDSRELLRRLGDILTPSAKLDELSFLTSDYFVADTVFRWLGGLTLDKLEIHFDNNGEGDAEDHHETHWTQARDVIEACRSARALGIYTDSPFDRTRAPLYYPCTLVTTRPCLERVAAAPLTLTVTVDMSCAYTVNVLNELAAASRPRGLTLYLNTDGATSDAFLNDAADATLAALCTHRGAALAGLFVTGGEYTVWRRTAEACALAGIPFQESK